MIDVTNYARRHIYLTRFDGTKTGWLIHCRHEDLSCSTEEMKSSRSIDWKKLIMGSGGVSIDRPDNSYYR